MSVDVCASTHEAIEIASHIGCSGASGGTTWSMNAMPSNPTVSAVWARSTLYPLVTGYPLPLPRIVPLAAVTGAVDVFHATNYVVPRAAQIPLVVTVHDLTLLHYPELGTKPLRRLVERTRHSVHEARLVITDSEATRRDVIQLLGAAEDKVRTVPLGCDPE